jgi:phosphoribosylanthranilate isomerase
MMVKLIKPKPLILAGGLNPDNVKEAIELVKPYAVDVCTGTERSPGLKDPVKVQRFLSTVSEINRRRINE